MIFVIIARIMDDLNFKDFKVNEAIKMESKQG